MRAGQRVYEQLRSEILNGEAGPGTPLGEVELSARFGTSRTPVREALGLLAADGLAEQSGARGTAVSRISSADIEPLFEVREALEVQSARLAARRCSPVDFACLADDLQRISLQLDEDPAPEEYYELVSRMDRMIDQAADNSWLVTALETVRTQLIRVRRLSAHDPTRLVRAAQEHAAIARAISSGSEQLAEAAVRLHLHEALNAAREKTETTTLERTS